MNDLNPFEFPEMAWLSTGADSQDRLKYHFHSHSGCSFAMSLSKSPVNSCCFLYVIRANPISGDLYIHSQVFLLVVGKASFSEAVIVCDCKPSWDGSKGRNSNVWAQGKGKCQQGTCLWYSACLIKAKEGLCSFRNWESRFCKMLPSSPTLGRKMCAVHMDFELCSCSSPSLKSQWWQG